MAQMVSINAEGVIFNTSNGYKLTLRMPTALTQDTIIDLPTLQAQASLAEQGILSATQLSSPVVVEECAQRTFQSTGAPTEVSYKLNYDGQQTALLSSANTSQEIYEALEALLTNGEIMASVESKFTGGGQYYLDVFIAPGPASEVKALTVSDIAFVGGTEPAFAQTQYIPEVNSVPNNYTTPLDTIVRFAGYGSQFRVNGLITQEAVSGPKYQNPNGLRWWGEI
jgi:hypothetical protein